MAKKSTKKKLTKKQIEKQQLHNEYVKIRYNFIRNVRSLESRGYDVSEIKIPDIPEKIGKREINALLKLKENRYNLVTKVETVTKRSITGEYIDVEERITGKRARRFERKRSGYKGVATKQEKEYKAQRQKSINRLEREAKEKAQHDYIKSLYDAGYAKPSDYIDADYDDDLYIDNFDDYVDSGSIKPAEPEGPYYDEYTGKVMDPIKGELKESDVDFSQYSYYMDTETGEIVERPKGAKRPKVEGAEFVRIMSTEDAGKLAYKRAIEELNIMSSYMGDPKHGKNLKHDERVRANADQIKAKLEALHGENPGAVERALSYTNSSGDFHSVDFMYRAGGYGAYLYYFESLLESLGADMDYESEEDYDEGNFEY